MSLEKQCAKCSLRFSNSNIYCPRCGTYWEQRKHTRSLADGVFVQSQHDGIMAPDKETKESIKPKSKSKINIICPACKNEISVEEDVPVITCFRCGELIDCKEAQKVTNQKLSSSDGLLSINENQIITRVATDQRHLPKKNPMPSTKPDDSIISFICLRSCGNIRLPNVNDNKIVLGTEGNYAEFFSDPMFKGIEKEHAIIQHEPSGWYMSPKRSNLNLRLNNIPVSSQQDSKKLTDNDKIYLGNCLLQVEIRSRTE